MVLEERMSELREEFAELEESLQRYSLLLQLAACAPQFPCDFTTREHLFPGCQTRVWLRVSWVEGVPNIEVTSDSMLLRGVGFILMRLLNGLPPEEYQSLGGWDIPGAMGLTGMFTSQRQQGISKLLEEIGRQIQEKQSVSDTEPAAPAPGGGCFF